MSPIRARHVATSIPIIFYLSQTLLDPTRINGQTFDYRSTKKLAQLHCQQPQENLLPLLRSQDRKGVGLDSCPALHSRLQAPFMNSAFGILMRIVVLVKCNSTVNRVQQILVRKGYSNGIRTPPPSSFIPFYMYEFV